MSLSLKHDGCSGKSLMPRCCSGICRMPPDIEYPDEMFPVGQKDTAGSCQLFSRTQKPLLMINKSSISQLLFQDVAKAQRHECRLDTTVPGAPR